MIGKAPPVGNEVVQVAWSLRSRASAAHPVMTVAPSWNVTVPVGVTSSVTVAVKVTEAPSLEGLADDETAVVVALSALTVYVVVPVDPAYPLPAVGVNTALRLSVPTGRVEVAVVATPPVTATGVPMSVVPTWNWTIPVAALGATVAVRVTEVPAYWGLVGEAARLVEVVVNGLTVKLAVPVEPENPVPAVGVNTALRLSVPTGRVDVDVVAMPPATVTGLPMSVVPTSNWTVPVATGATVAFKVTEVPAYWGLVGVAIRVVVVAVSGLTV